MPSNRSFVSEPFTILRRSVASYAARNLVVDRSIGRSPEIRRTVGGLGNPKRAGSSGSRSTPPWHPRTVTYCSHRPNRNVWLPLCPLDIVCDKKPRGCSTHPTARTPHAPPTDDLTRNIPPSRSGHRIHTKRTHACLCSPVFLLEPSGYMGIVSSGKGAEE